MASNRIKGLTIQIGADTSDLSKALSGVNKEIKSTQDELKDVERLLKLDPTNTELLKQKQELLAKAVGETKEKLDTLKKAEQQLKDSGVDENSAQFRGLQREIIATQQSLDNLEEQAKQSNAVMSQIGASASKIASGAQAVADKTKALSTAAAGAVAAIGALALKSAQAADELNTLSQQSGLSTDELQKFQYASKIVDVSTDSIVGALKKMRKNMNSTSSDVTSAWEQIGVAVKNEDGSFRDATQVFYETLEGLSQIENETERDIVAMSLFGKSADELAGIIDDGGAALKALGQEAEDLGLILDGETLDAMNAVNDTIDKTKAKAQALLSQTGAKALEAIAPVLDTIIDKLGKVFEWIGNLNTEQIQTGLAIAAAVAAISPIAGIIAKISGAVSSLIPLVSKVFSFISANPLFAVAAAVLALTALVIKNWDKIKDALEKGWAEIKSVVNTIKNYVWDNVVAPIGNFFVDMINGVISALNFVIRGLNKIQITLPNWGILGDLAGKSFGVNIGEIGYLDNLQTSAQKAANATASGGTASSMAVAPVAGRTLDMSTMGNAAAPTAATATSSATNVNIEFTGSLAQLGRVLQPVVTTETARLGGTLVR